MKDSLFMLQELYELKFSQKEIEGPIEHVLQPKPNSSKDLNWLDFRLSILLTEAIQSTQTTFVMDILPRLEFDPSIGTSVIALGSFLDDELSDYIDRNNIQLKNNARLYDRINSVSSSLGNLDVKSLHNLRIARNNHAHNIPSPIIDWDEVKSHADNLENALLAMSVIQESTNLRIEGVEVSAIQKSPDNEHFRFRFTDLNIFRHNTEFIKYRWKSKYTFGGNLPS